MKKISAITIPSKLGKTTNFSQSIKIAFCYFSLLGIIVLGIDQIGFSLKGIRLLSFSSDLYGPFVDKHSFKNKTYSFSQVNGSFGNIPVFRLEEFDKESIHQVVLESIDPWLRGKASQYISYVFQMAQKYQVDPIWALSILWTESHFDKNARSIVNAQGLMQLMPETAHFISHKIKRPISMSLSNKLIREPSFNIEIGVYYLKRLHRHFNNSYRLATVAYNLGPGNVRYRRRNGLPVGVKNQYLNKVRRNYNKIRDGLAKNLFHTPMPYRSTLVVRKRFMYPPVSLPSKSGIISLKLL